MKPSKGTVVADSFRIVLTSRIKAIPTEAIEVTIARNDRSTADPQQPIKI